MEEQDNYLDEELNLAEFKQPASDTKGHGDRLPQLKVHPTISRMVSEYIESKIFPYKTKTDLMRHAIVRHIKWLDTMQKTGIQFYDNSLDAVNRILTQEEERIRFVDSMDRLQQDVQWHMAKGNVEMAKSLLARTYSDVSSMPDEEPWKKIYQQEMRARFGNLLDSLPAVRLWEGR